MDNSTERRRGYDDIRIMLGELIAETRQIRRDVDALMERTEGLKADNDRLHGAKYGAALVASVIGGVIGAAASFVGMMDKA